MTLKLPTLNRPAWIALAVIVALLLGVGGKTLFFPAKKAAEVATATASLSDIEQTVLATGTLEPVELVSVGAQVSGQVTSLKVELGQVVRKGQVIAEIDSQAQQNALRTAQAEVANVRAQRAQAQATLAEATQTYERQKTMLAADATSRADYDAAVAAMKSAQGSVSALDAQVAKAAVSVETANVNLGYTRIVAPMDGTIVAIVTKEGQTVNANQSAPTIVKLAKLDVMTVKAEISEADVIKVTPGQDVYFTILGDPAKRYYGKLRTVEPAPESIEDEDSASTTSTSSEAVYYNGLFDIDNADGRLRTSMTAQVYVILAQAKNVLTIPSSALGPKAPDGGYVVRVQGRNGKVEPRKITIGINNNVTAQVKSGLAVGEKVLTGEVAAPPADAAKSNAGAPGGPPGGGMGL